MGIIRVTLSVANVSDPETAAQVDCIVDSGAVYSVIPAAVLTQLGIKPVAQEQFRLANGEIITRDKGVALFQYEGRVGGADVVFGAAGDESLLGALTLEALGLALDPLRRELKPLPLML